MIESCSFGFMVIEGKRYTSDLIISPDGQVADHWRRRRGHSLCLEDLRELLDACPEVIVAGTGTSGMVKPEKGLEESLSPLGVELIAAPNHEAVELFNELTAKKRVGGCFHLTC